MSTASAYLEVSAKGLDSRVARLEGFEKDCTLVVNLISATKAQAIRGAQPTPLHSAEDFQDSQNRRYRCTHKVTLRWWEATAPRSFSGTFYITSGCPPGVDAIVCPEVYNNFEEGQGPSCKPVRAPVENKAFNDSIR